MLSVKKHQLKLVALLFLGFACPPLADVSIHQFLTGSIKIGRINNIAINQLLISTKLRCNNADFLIVESCMRTDFLPGNSFL